MNRKEQTVIDKIALKSSIEHASNLYKSKALPSSITILSSKQKTSLYDQKEKPLVVLEGITTNNSKPVEATNKPKDK